MEKLLKELAEDDGAKFAEYPQLVDLIDNLTQVCSQAKFAEQILQMGLSSKSIQRLQERESAGSRHAIFDHLFFLQFLTKTHVLFYSQHKIKKKLIVHLPFCF